MKRADEIMVLRGYKRSWICSELNISASSFTDWSKRGTIPSSDTLLYLADKLDISFRWLLTGKYEKDELTLDERNILASWRNLDEQGQYEVKALLNAKSTPAPVKKTMQAG